MCTQAPAPRHATDHRSIPRPNVPASSAPLNPTTSSAGGGDTGDKILDDLLVDERRAKEIIEWFRVNQQVDVSTMDLPELEQLFAEQGPGTTLGQDHEPYPHVRIPITCMDSHLLNAITQVHVAARPASVTRSALSHLQGLIMSAAKLLIIFNYHSR
jgi:hypothetical protein